MQKSISNRTKIATVKRLQHLRSKIIRHCKPEAIQSQSFLINHQSDERGSFSKTQQHNVDMN